MDAIDSPQEAHQLTCAPLSLCIWPRSSPVASPFRSRTLTFQPPQRTCFSAFKHQQCRAGKASQTASRRIQLPEHALRGNPGCKRAALLRAWPVHVPACFQDRQECENLRLLPICREDCFLFVRDSANLIAVRGVQHDATREPTKPSLDVM